MITGGDVMRPPSNAKMYKINAVFKMEFFQALGNYCLGVASEENGEYGAAVGYFRQAKQCLGEFQKIFRTSNEYMTLMNFVFENF